MTMFQTLHRMMGGAATLKMSCEKCGYEATWTSAQAKHRLGPDATPMECRRRLVCSRCGVVGQVRVWI